IDDAAECGSDLDGDAVRVERSRVEARVLEGQAGGSHGELGVPIHPLRSGSIQMVERVEVIDLGGDVTPEDRGIEAADTANRRLSAAEPLPEAGGGGPDRSDAADARNGHATRPGFTSVPWLFHRAD